MGNLGEMQLAKGLQMDVAEPVGNRRTLTQGALGGSELAAPARDQSHVVQRGGTTAFVGCLLEFLESVVVVREGGVVITLDAVEYSQILLDPRTECW